MFAVLLVAANASATSCWVFISDDPLREAIQHSDLVFIGEAVTSRKTTIRHKDSEEFIVQIDTTFVMEESLKGQVESTILISGESGKPCQCRYDFEPGVSYLVLASRSDDSLVTKYCRFIKPADEDVVSDARNSAG